MSSGHRRRPSRRPRARLRCAPLNDKREHSTSLGISRLEACSNLRSAAGCADSVPGANDGTKPANEHASAVATSPRDLTAESRNGTRTTGSHKRPACRRCRSPARTCTCCRERIHRRLVEPMPEPADSTLMPCTCPLSSSSTRSFTSPSMPSCSASTGYWIERPHASASMSGSFLMYSSLTGWYTGFGGGGGAAGSGTTGPMCPTWPGRSSSCCRRAPPSPSHPRSSTTWSRRTPAWAAPWAAPWAARRWAAAPRGGGGGHLDLLRDHLALGRRRRLAASTLRRRRRQRCLRTSISTQVGRCCGGARARATARTRCRRARRARRRRRRDRASTAASPYERSRYGLGSVLSANLCTPSDFTRSTMCTTSP